jgi:hypothetical protein
MKIIGIRTGYVHGRVEAACLSAMLLRHTFHNLRL